jgi:hypothetical protein
VPVLRILFISLLLWLTAFAFCKFTYWRDPHSAFFKSEHVYDLQYSTHRQTEARNFIEVAGSDVFGRHAGKGNKTIMCAAFVTVKRDGRQYLDEAIGSMLEGLDPREREAIALSVLFADTKPEIHPQMNAPWTKVLDWKFTYATSRRGITAKELSNIREMERKRNFYVKGVFDYLMVLEECMAKTHAPYIGIFEDDLIFAEGWMARTLRGLGELEQKNQTALLTTGQPLARWIYLRLFYTETSLSWQTESDFWYRNIHLAFLLTSSISLGFFLWLRKYSTPSTPHLDNFSIAALTLVMVGKYSLKPLQGVVPMNKFGCCTQAMVFPRTEVPALMDYLKGRGHGQTDSMIEEYSDRDGLERYALAPQVLQHVGLVSSRDNTFVK